MTRFTLSLLITAALLFVACDPSTAPVVTLSETDCTANEAQIRISDGYFQNLCGCVEAAGTIVRSGNFTCTVKVGTTVFFLYIDTHLDHEIISTGGLPIASTGVNQPGSSSNQNVTALFQTAGTADFADAFNNNIAGQIIVTP
jgi:hypothetical protein